MSKGLTIDFETADRITVLSLKDHLNYLKQEVKDHVENGNWMHPEDFEQSVTKLIPALETVLKYYGEDQS